MKKELLLLLATIIFSFQIFAQGGDDNASNSAYDSGWNDGTNGGTGFTAWAMNPNPNNGNAGFFIGSSDINVSGESWGIYGNSGNTASAVRSFMTAPDAADIISIKMDNANIDNGGVVGIGLRNGSGENLLEVFFRGGNSNYIVNEATGEKDSGLGYSNTGVEIEITLPTATTYSAKITNIVSSVSQTVTGSLMNPSGGQGIAQFRIFNFNAGTGGGSDQFFNELSHAALEPLPVELASFSATSIFDHIQLDWTTASERNNDFFSIEKSEDGINFKELGIRKGVGNSTTNNNYQMLDNDPTIGLNYYRLLQIDLDGASEYSEIISVDFKGNNEMSFFPNPAKEKLTIVSDLENHSVEISIFNINGQMVQISKFQIDQQLSLDISKLNSGFYFLQIRERNGVILLSKRFIKE